VAVEAIALVELPWDLLRIVLPDKVVDRPGPLAAVAAALAVETVPEAPADVIVTADAIPTSSTA
jgi:hypothetical protein